MASSALFLPSWGRFGPLGPFFFFCLLGPFSAFSGLYLGLLGLFWGHVLTTWALFLPSWGPLLAPLGLRGASSGLLWPFLCLPAAFFRPSKDSVLICSNSVLPSRSNANDNHKGFAKKAKPSTREGGGGASPEASSIRRPLSEGRVQGVLQISFKISSKSSKSSNGRSRGGPGAMHRRPRARRTRPTRRSRPASWGSKNAVKT